MSRDAHCRETQSTDPRERGDNQDLLRRIYGYAAWSLAHPDHDVWNAGGVCFYEHLFDEPWTRPLVVPWLSPKIWADVFPLWEARLDKVAIREIEQLFAARRPPSHPKLPRRGQR